MDGLVSPNCKNSCETLPNFTFYDFSFSRTFLYHNYIFKIFKSSLNNDLDFRFIDRISDWSGPYKKSNVSDDIM